MRRGGGGRARGRRGRDRERDRDDASEREPAVEPARASEELLIALLPEVRGARVLALSIGRGQLALAAASGDPARSVTCPFLDLYLAERAREHARIAAAEPATAAPGDAEDARAAIVESAAPAPPANLSIECVADLPPGPFDAALVPMRAGADSELAWELLQSAHERLVDGGQLFASVDEPRDRWVLGRMEALFGRRIGRRAAPGALAYVGTRRGPLAKLKRFECEFAFRDRGRLVHVVSRPGVFSHRHLDLGARALIESLAEPIGGAGGAGGGEKELVFAGARVLDLGCGSGAVGFAAALRAPDVTVHAVDSMPRALDCTRLGAERNGLADRVTTQLSADGAIDPAVKFDLVLANPPYYSQHAIAGIFVAAARRALNPGGRVHFVTRQSAWFEERLAAGFRDVRVRPLRGYAVVTALRR